MGRTIVTHVHCESLYISQPSSAKTLRGFLKMQRGKNDVRNSRNYGSWFEQIFKQVQSLWRRRRQCFKVPFLSGRAVVTQAGMWGHLVNLLFFCLCISSVRRIFLVGLHYLSRIRARLAICSYFQSNNDSAK